MTGRFCATVRSGPFGKAEGNVMSSEELEQVWNSIKSEARALADCEPMLASFFHATLLKHENLGSALSYMLANKLATPIMPAIAVREVVEEAYKSDNQMIVSAARDILAVRLRDPAVDKYPRRCFT